MQADTSVPNMAEIWKPVPGFETHYSVSNLGRVMNARTGRVLRPRLDRGKYFVVGLWRDGVGVTRKVHSLVCEAFHGPRPNGHECNHKDGVKANNRGDNLEWVTGLRNHQHASEIGLKAVGKRHGSHTCPESRPHGDRNGSRLHPERVARGERSGAYTHPECVLRGESHGNSKITNADVLAIRADTRPHRTIAREYFIGTTTVGLIKARKTWAHV